MKSSDRERVALNSLKEISDYSDCIEQHIHKLDKLYRSLEVNKNRNNNSHQGIPPQPIAPKFYRTAKESFNFTSITHKKESPQQMYHTQYQAQKSYRYGSKPKQRALAELRSVQISQSTAKKINPIVKSNNHNNQQQEYHWIYKKIKDRLLEVFFVGGRPSDELLFDNIRLNQINQCEPKNKRGRLWHGRPPAKIIEKFD